jgi:hypothetical protein
LVFWKRQAYLLALSTAFRPFLRIASGPLP